MFLKRYIGVIFSLTLIFYLVFKFDWASICEILINADPIYVVLASCFQLLNLLVRSVRWQYLLHPIKNIPFTAVISATAIGTLGNNILPARMGELVRTRLLAKQQGMSTTSTFSTLVVEKVMELACLMALVIIIIFSSTADSFFLPLTSFLGTQKTLLKYATIIFISILAIFLFFLMIQNDRHKNKLVNLFVKILPFSNRSFIESTSTKMIVGLDLRLGWRKLLLIILLSFVLWFFIGIRTFLSLEALNLGITLEASFLMVVILTFALTIPSAPGFWGNFHFVVIYILGLMNVDENLAASAAILLHGIYFFVSSIVGLIFLFCQKNHFMDFFWKTAHSTE